MIVLQQTGRSSLVQAFSYAAVQDEPDVQVMKTIVDEVLDLIKL